MKNAIFSAVLLLILTPAFAQERTYDFYNRNSNALKKEAPSILVATYDSKMYRSDVDRELGKHNQLSQEEIQRFFQKAMTSIVMEKFANEYNVSDLESVEQDSSFTLLSLLHEHIKYQYEDLPSEKTNSDFLNTLKKEDGKQAGIKEGQVAIETKNKEGYMKAYIKNDTILEHLHQKYPFDYIVLLNEFDLTYLVENPDQAAYGGIKKRIRTHYTIYNSKGKLIASGAEDGLLSNQEKNVYSIAGAALPQVAEKMLLNFKSETEKKEED